MGIEFIFSGHVYHAKDISKLALPPPQRNKLTTSVFNYLQPRLSVLIPDQHSSFSVADGLMYIEHKSTAIPKTPKILKDFHRVCTEPVDLDIWYPRQVILPTISSMTNIVPRLSNVRQQFKSFNRLLQTSTDHIYVLRVATNSGHSDKCMD